MAAEKGGKGISGYYSGWLFAMGPLIILILIYA